jgi:hypothetical protein
MFIRAVLCDLFCHGLAPKFGLGFLVKKERSRGTDFGLECDRHVDYFL